MGQFLHAVQHLFLGLVDLARHLFLGGFYGFYFRGRCFLHLFGSSIILFGHLDYFFLFPLFEDCFLRVHHLTVLVTESIGI